MGGGEDGCSFGPGPNINIRAKLAICISQGEAQEAKRGASEQCPGAEQRKRVG